MKKLVLNIFLLFCIVGVSVAQLDRSKLPAPGPAPKISIGNYETFTLPNGLQVFVVEDHKLPIVNVRLSINVDPILEGEMKGYVDYVGDLMSAGTAKRTKQQIGEEMDFVGADFNMSSDGFFGNSLKKHLGTLLDIASDVLLNPVFPESELALLKKRSISGLASSKTSAGYMAQNALAKVMYGSKHPYGEIMTEQSIEKISLDACKNYYNTYMKPNVSYLIFVGDINVKEAKKLAKQYFGAWAKGTVPTHTYEMPQGPKGNQVFYVVKENAPQSTVNIGYPLDYKPGNPDAIKAGLMNEVLGGGIFSGRLMNNLREAKGYTYGARSSISADKLTGSFLASAEVKGNITDSAVMAFFEEIGRMKNDKISKEELELSINASSGMFALRLQSANTIANFALNIARYKLPADYYQTYLENLAKVSIDDVYAMAQKYMKPQDAYIVVVGPREMLEKLKALDADKEVTVLDSNGDLFVEVKAKSAGDVNCKQVIDNYIKAIGGTENLSKVSNYAAKMSMNMQGMNIGVNLFKKQTNKLLLEMKMGEMVLSKQLLNGDKASIEAQGRKMDANAEQLAKMQSEAVIFPELGYHTADYTLNLLGVEPVNGSDAYKIEVVMKGGRKVTEFYDVKSALKVKVVETQKTPMGDMESVTLLQEYKAFNNIMLPTINITQVAGQEMKMVLESLDMNAVISDDIFKL
ncbi:MAG TPA: peptidase M16 [Bacteroidales bacterium]|nr:peptidase M16 [Bacteroidales bacterium]